MQVKKRDGRIVAFDKNCIVLAITKAFEEVDGICATSENDVAHSISEEIASMNKNLSVEEIQDLVELKLMHSDRKDVAKAYILYRNKRNIERDKQSEIMKRVLRRINATSVDNSNANVDENSFSGREKESNTEIGKAIALDYDGLSKVISDAHKEMLVYQHDLEKAVYGIHNCLFVDFNKLFTDGFRTKNGDIRPPSTFATACQLVAVIFQCQSQVQFGGVASAHIDYDLAPFLKMSFQKHYKIGCKYIGGTVDVGEICIDNKLCQENTGAYNYALDMLEIECKQSCEALYHNLNTLESRQGSQVPFTSINLGRDTSTYGRLITKYIFEASLSGIGKHHLTPIFPISIFQYKKGTNASPKDNNYDLKQLALKSLSKRIYPNFVNCDWSQANETEDIDSRLATMGKCKLAHVKPIEPC